MYPLADGFFTPRNHWYVAILSHEVTREPVERWILDEPVAFYRKEDGTVVALDGRCPHRSFPLGKSRVVGNDIECGYHGLRFGPDGQCTSIPSQDFIPRVCHVRSYPVAERWKWIWVWTGDPELADESLIPDLHQLGVTDPSVRSTVASYRYVKGRAMLLNDNLLDLTHVQFLHRDLFGAGTTSAQVPRHSEGPNWVATHYEEVGATVPPLLNKILNRKGLIDRVFGLKFLAPSIHFGNDDVFAHEANGARGANLGSVKIVHVVTPATKTTCHYWLALGHNWSHMPDSFLEMFAGKITPGIDEDVSATEYIEKMLEHKGGRASEVLLKADHVAVRGRRLMEKMIQAENPNDVSEEQRMSDAADS